MNPQQPGIDGSQALMRFPEVRARWIPCLYVSPHLSPRHTGCALLASLWHVPAWPMSLSPALPSLGCWRPEIPTATLNASDVIGPQ